MLIKFEQWSVFMQDLIVSQWLDVINEFNKATTVFLLWRKSQELLAWTIERSVHLQEAILSCWDRVEANIES